MFTTRAPIRANRRQAEERISIGAVAHSRLVHHDTGQQPSFRAFRLLFFQNFQSLALICQLAKLHDALQCFASVHPPPTRLCHIDCEPRTAVNVKLTSAFLVHYFLFMPPCTRPWEDCLLTQNVPLPDGWTRDKQPQGNGVESFSDRISRMYAQERTALHQGRTVKFI